VKKFPCTFPNSNFGFDVIDTWVKKGRNKLAMICVNQKDEEKKYSFPDLSNLLNKATSILVKYNIHKGDRVLVMLPRPDPGHDRGGIHCPEQGMGLRNP
jgi:acyl-coenzyme A synthetase/AMP-(fatty) acid ligase